MQQLEQYKSFKNHSSVSTLRFVTKNAMSNFLSNHATYYPTPITINYFWNFGFLAGLCLIIQLVSGIFLAMHYSPDIALAFDSVERIMRSVNNGWLLRYVHANGASMFLLVVYLHIGRGLFYKSFRGKNSKVWITGVFIFLLLMATAFLGYVLPWGQMSFWGATVITNLVSAIPCIGQTIAYWLWGGFAVGNATLVRFFILHFILPFVILGLVFLHILLLHEGGSSTGIDDDNVVANDFIMFYPYFILKDGFSFFVFALVFGDLVFFHPNLLMHPDNYIKANPLSTPAHIVPEWYFLPFYAILRAIPDKLMGVVTMFCSILILLLLPFVSTKAFIVETISDDFENSYRLETIFYEFYEPLFWCWVATFVSLGWLGASPIEAPFLELSGAVSALYFCFFFIFFF